jgi:hypothetical protein
MSENSGVFNKVKDSAMGVAGKFLELPDKPSHPVARKVARIAFDILVIGLSYAAFALMTGGIAGIGDLTHFFPHLFNAFNPNNILGALADPSLGTLMAMPMCIGAAGIGTSWLIQDILGKKGERIAAKIAAIVLPVLCFGAAAAFIAAGVHQGKTWLSFTNNFMAGLLLVPLGFFALHHSIKKLNRKEVVYYAGNLSQENRPSPSTLGKNYKSGKKRQQ